MAWKSNIAVGLAVAFVFAFASIPVPAHERYADVEIVATEVSDGIHMLTGAGGNIAVLSGWEGVILVDAQFAPLVERIREAVAKISPEPIRFLVNTHWHGDHTGGNEGFARLGSVIVAHENTRERMSVEQLIEAFGARVPPSPRAALPVVTFTAAVTFHLNDEEVHAFHVPRAHTDGDTVVHFRTSDVLHMGDLFFNGAYPFIDLSSGGSIHGLLAGVEKVLSMVTPETRIIPGHGPLGTPAELLAYQRMLQSIYHRVAALRAEGSSLEEVLAARPSAAWDEEWGQAFISGEVFTRTVYQSLERQAERAGKPR
jgi:cyclase